MAENLEWADQSLIGRPLKRFFRMLSIDKREIVYIYIYAIFNGLINLSLPLGIQAIIGLTLANEISSSWVVLIVVVTAGTAIAGLMQIMQISLTELLQQRIFARAAFEFAWRLPRLKMEKLTKYYPPELVNRFFDTLNVQKGLPKILIDFSQALLQILFGMLLLSFYHPFFVFFGLGLMLILFLIFRFTGPKGLASSLEESDYKYQVAYWLEEIARTITTFKLAGETNLAVDRTNTLVKKYLSARKKHFNVLIFQFGNIVGFKTIVTAGLLILGSILLMERQINLGQFVASEIIIILIIGSVEKLVLSAETVYDVLTAMEKLGKISDLPLERHLGINFEEEDTKIPMEIRIKDMSFTFPGDPLPSLNHLSMDAAPGESICIAGFNGSGKTLLLNIISGMYENHSGVISYNDIPMKNYDPISLRGYIGDCLTQKVLFRGTVLENLTVGRPNITMESIRWTLEKLELTDYIHSLPEGLNTEMIPEGPQVPESISRKLILARSIVKRPRLLVMDDFLRTMDPGERDRIGTFLTGCPLWTLVVASNDPIFAAKCSKVYVLSQGTFTDSGTFEQIIQKPYAGPLFGLSQDQS